MRNEPELPSDPAELARLPHSGDVIAGKYQIDKVIGAGGMGVVVLARHLLLNQPVAMKFLHPQSAVRSDPVQRFLREARAAAALRSEHVARVIDVGTLPSGDPFMVMEYLEGSPLSRVIRKRAPLPIDEAVDYILQACDAMGEAHQIGIIHRDLKPGNMFIIQRPNGSSLLKVLDFGISKYLDSDSETHEQTLTSTNMVMGSPQYASPEQLRSAKHVDPRADIWSMGVILYYMLTGRRPFEGDSMSALLTAIAIEEPIPVTTLRYDVPLALQSVVMRCLEKDRERRIPDIRTLAAALSPFAPTGVPAIPSSSSSLGALMPASARFDPSSQRLTPSIPQVPTEQQAATSMTRSAWATPAPVRRPGHVVAIQLATAVAAVVAVLVIYREMRGSPGAETRQVEAVSVATAAPTREPEPKPAVVSDDPIIDPTFAPAPSLATPPTTGAQARPAAPSKPRVWGIANRPLTLLDKSGAVVGKVIKGARVQLVREADGWSLVVYSSNQGLTMGWAPTNAIASDP